MVYTWLESIGLPTCEACTQGGTCRGKRGISPSLVWSQYYSTTFSYFPMPWENFPPQCSASLVPPTNSTRFVVKPEGGQRGSAMYFWLNQWGVNENLGRLRGTRGGLNPQLPTNRALPTNTTRWHVFQRKMKMWSLLFWITALLVCCILICSLVKWRFFDSIWWFDTIPWPTSPHFLQFEYWL